MDDVLPSYESAVHQDPWKLVAPYLSAPDLCSAALVCRRWHTIFTLQLWGSPASHFRVQDDTIYVALPSFMHTLYFARHHVLAMTHTLNFPSANAGVYGGPHDGWLRDVLEQLPNLQSLIINELPFFDDACMHNLRYPSPLRQASISNNSPIFGLRLLDASGCKNATSSGLAVMLTQCPHLVFLNLSRTPTVKNGRVLEGLKSLRNLRVLKLAGLGLKDADLGIIAASIGTRVRSLDISENHLTDASARLLVENCIKDVGSIDLLASVHRSGGEEPEVDEEQRFGTVDLDAHVRRKLTHGFIGGLAVERTIDAGVAELNVSGNSLTVDGVAALLRSKQLSVLDIGSLHVARRRSGSPASNQIDEWRLPGVEKLVPALADSASKSLRYLRLGHTVVTKDALLEQQPPSLELADDAMPSTNLQLRLHPSMLPEVLTLTLTDVPSKAYDSQVAQRLIQFIRACAEETTKARLQAKDTYMVPPGRSRSVAEREYAQSLFALRRIVLEVAAPEVTRGEVSSSWRGQYPTLSSTEDADSDAFWAAAAGDFSFFGSDDESDVLALKAGQSKAPAEPEVDVIAEIAKFRKERKMAYESRVLEVGEAEAIVDGYWPGDVVVVRNTTDANGGSSDRYKKW